MNQILELLIDTVVESTPFATVVLWRNNSSFTPTGHWCTVINQHCNCSHQVERKTHIMKSKQNVTRWGFYNSSKSSFGITGLICDAGSVNIINSLLSITFSGRTILWLCQRARGIVHKAIMNSIIIPATGMDTMHDLNYVRLASPFVLSCKLQI